METVYISLQYFAVLLGYHAQEEYQILELVFPQSFQNKYLNGNKYNFGYLSGMLNTYSLLPLFGL